MKDKKYQLRLTSREAQTLCFAISQTFNFEKVLGIDDEDKANIWKIYTKAIDLRNRILDI